MSKTIQFLIGVAFFAGAAGYAGYELQTTKGAQTYIACCRDATGCPGGMKCDVSVTNCQDTYPENPPRRSKCITTKNSNSSTYIPSEDSN